MARCGTYRWTAQIEPFLSEKWLECGGLNPSNNPKIIIDKFEISVMMLLMSANTSKPTTESDNIVRVNIRVPDALHRKVKAKAANMGISMESAILQALEALIK